MIQFYLSPAETNEEFRFSFKSWLKYHNHCLVLSGTAHLIVVSDNTAQKKKKKTSQLTHVKYASFFHA